MTTPRKKPGRPRTRPGRRRLEAYFSDSELAAIQRAADRAGLPVSHFLRAAVLQASDLNAARK